MEIETIILLDMCSKRKNLSEDHLLLFGLVAMPQNEVQALSLLYSVVCAKIVI